MRVAEMWILWWISEHTLRDRIRNEDIRLGLDVPTIEDKIKKNRLRLFVLVRGQSNGEPVMKIESWNLRDFKQEWGWPNMTWRVWVENDMKIFDLDFGLVEIRKPKWMEKENSCEWLLKLIYLLGSRLWHCYYCGVHLGYWCGRLWDVFILQIEKRECKLYQSNLHKENPCPIFLSFSIMRTQTTFI